MTVLQDVHTMLFLLLAASPRQATHIVWPHSKILEFSLISLQVMQGRYLYRSCGLMLAVSESGLLLAILRRCYSENFMCIFKSRIVLDDSE